MIWILFSIGYVVAGWFAAGYVYAHSQREYPRIAREMRRSDARLVLIAFLTGYGGLLVVLAQGKDRHGRLYPWQSTQWRA
jgi:hypothetical protein